MIYIWISEVGHQLSDVLSLCAFWRMHQIISRIPYCFGIGKQGSSPLYDYSRKLAYVGMSRPRKLLCVAMQSETYEKSKGAFNSNWEIVDLR